MIKSEKKKKRKIAVRMANTVDLNEKQSDEGVINKRI